MAMTLSFKVRGMGCQGCVDAVSGAIRQIAPAARVSIDLSGGLVEVTDASNPIEVEHAISRAGFTVEERLR